MYAPPPAKSGGAGTWWESQSVLCNCLMPCNDRWIIVIKAFIRVEIRFENGSVNCLKRRGRKESCQPASQMENIYSDSIEMVFDLRPHVTGG